MSDPNIHIVVNGDAREVASSTTISQLLDQLGLVKERIAVELNEDIISRPRFDTFQLSDGDRLELVTFVGGG